MVANVGELTNDTVYISFSAEINIKTIEQLLGTAFEAIQQLKAKHLYFLFSTPGGIVAQGLTVYNTLLGLPAKITMHNVGNVDSIGNAIFLAGHERVASPHATFMFHGVGFDITQQMRLERKDLEERLQGIKADEKRIGSIIAEKTSLEPRQVDTLFRKAYTKDANFALEKGFIHEIRETNIPEGARVIQLIFKR